MAFNDSGMSETDIAKEMEVWANNQLQKAEKVAEKKQLKKKLKLKKL